MKTLFSIINLSQAWRTKKQKSRAAGRFENQSSYSLRRQKNVETKRHILQICVAFSEKLIFTIQGLLNEKVLFLFLHKHVYFIFRCFILCHFWTMNLSAWFLPNELWKSHLKMVFSAPFCPLVPLALKTNLRWDCRCSFGWNQADRLIVQKWHGIKLWKR